MTYDAAQKFWNSYIRMINKGFANTIMANPAVKFAKEAKQGWYDHLSPEEYDEKVNNTDAISAFCENKPTESAGTILLNAINKTNLSDAQINRITAILAKASENTDYQYMQDNRQKHNSQVYNENEYMTLCTSTTTLYTPEDDNTPQSIYNYLCHHIYKQEAAKKAAAIMMYNHINSNSRHMLMAGATGCGKTEIWNTLQKKYQFIQIINGPQLAADGWRGSYHISDIFLNAPREFVQNLVIVIDEADKMLEPAIGANGTDFAILLQNELLKIMDGGMLTFTNDKDGKSITVDCSNISIILCGSFERMLNEKTKASKNIGFNTPESTESQIVDCNEEDLIKYGNVRREIAGRINQIVCLQTLTTDDFKNILESEMSPIQKIEQSQHVSLSIDKNSKKKLAEEAANSHLGCRYIRSRLQCLLDEKIFENPNEEEYNLYYE